MTIIMMKAMEDMDNLIVRMNTVNGLGISKTIDTALERTAMRKQIVLEMDKAQLVILDELKKG